MPLPPKILPTIIKGLETLAKPFTFCVHIWVVYIIMSYGVGSTSTIELVPIAK